MSTETAPKLPPKPSREQARVLYPYEAQNEDELTINEGDIINVLSKEIEDQGWFKGELNGKVGVFPDNFVELIPMESDDHPQPKPPPPRPAAHGAKGGSSSMVKGGSSVDGGSSSKALNGSKSTTPTILNKILGGGSKSKSPATTTSPGLNVSAGTGRGSPSGIILSSSPKSTSGKGGPPDVVPHSEGNNRCSVSNAEENETITDLDTSVSKLLTNPTRPKGPTNRRPPSYIAIVKDESGLENGDNNHNNRSISNHVDANSKTTTNNHNNDGHKLNSPSTNSKPSAFKGKTTVVGQLDTSKDSDQPPAPWMIELRKTQELKRGGSKDLPCSETSTTPPEPSTVPGVVPRPVSTTSSAVRAHNRASGDFSARMMMQALLKKDGSSVEETTSTSTTSGGNPVVTTTATTTSNKPNKPLNKPGGGSSPLTSSITSLTTCTSSMNTTSAVSGSKINPSSNISSVPFNNNASSLLDKSSSNSNEQDNCKILTHLQDQIKLMKESMVPRKDFDDLAKQMSELKNSFEAYKLSKKQEMKELINDVAEERTKVATLQIEVDRLRKLSTTV